MAWIWAFRLFLACQALVFLGCDYEEHARGQEAAAQALKSCSAGDQEACTELGEMYERGSGVRRSSDDAIRYYRPACEEGILRACNKLGLIYLGDFDLPADYGKVQKYLRNNCEAGYVDSCYNLAAFYHNPERGNDSAKARRLWQPLCEEQTGLEKDGVLKACVAFAAVLSFNAENEAVRDWPKASSLFLRACDGGEPGGCMLLGMHYLNGAPGLEKDVDKGLSLLQRACEEGMNDACNDLKQHGQ